MLTFHSFPSILLKISKINVIVDVATKISKGKGFGISASIGANTIAMFVSMFATVSTIGTKDLLKILLIARKLIVEIDFSQARIPK